METLQPYKAREQTSTRSELVLKNKKTQMAKLAGNARYDKNARSSTNYAALSKRKIAKSTAAVIERFIWRGNSNLVTSKLLQK